MANQGKHVYGYIERATLVDNQVPVVAKLDTGAKSASLNATHITQVNLKGKPYLRFTVPSKTGDHVFTCEYAGVVNIKMRVAESKLTAGLKHYVRRPVVRMLIQLGDQQQLIRVNLTNRKRFLYPLLLGREALIAFNGVVDPALTYTLSKKDMAPHENI
jgi:hypothetical protein